MRKKLLVAIVLLLSLNVGVYADEIRLRTTKTSAVTISVVTSAIGVVTVDWGNGLSVTTNITQTDINGATTPITGDPTGDIIVRGSGLTVFDCSGSAITNVDVTQAPNLIKLSVNNNALTSIDLTQNIALTSLHLEANPDLSTLDVSKNTALQQLYCNDNNIVGLDVSKNTSLTTLNINNNKIVSIDLSTNTALKSLYALNNLIESIDLSKNTALTYISLNTNRLTALDVTPLTALKSLFVANNNLVSLTGVLNLSKTATLNCSGNKLNLATLPQPELVRTTFTYAPQQAYIIPTSVKVNESIDLSSQNNLKGVTTSLQTTTYQWSKKSGAILVKNTDYEENNGVFTFLKTQDEPIICSMSTAAFPKFTTTNILKTTEMMVVLPTLIKETESMQIKLMPNPVTDRIIITANSIIHQVEIFNVTSRLLMSIETNTSRIEMNTTNLEDGVYVAKLTTDSGVSTLKFIVKK